MKIALTNGGYALIDDEDYALVSAKSWYKNGARIRDTSYKIELSRYIMNPDVGLVVDHINGDTFDNRRSNLRICSVAENARNKRCRRSDSGFIGVNRDKRSKVTKYHAAVIVDRKKHYIGTFTDPVEAAKARDELAKKLHGQFAVLNFPEDE